MNLSLRGTGGRVLVASMLAALLVTGCGDQASDGAGGGGETTTAESPSTAPPSTTSPPTTEAAQSPEPASGTLVEVVVRDGAVEGGVREVRVPLGEEVTLRVTSDVADRVHVHGYDLLVDVAPGEVGELQFVADLPGVWEVELEGAGLDLVALQVS